MRISKKILNISTVFAIIGCGNSIENSRKYVVKKDDSGNLLSQEYYINDSVLDSTAMYYFSNGNIHIKRNYINGIKNGWSETYYENGKIQSKIYYINGNREGKSFSFYINGKKKEEVNYLNNKAFGDALYFYNNEQLETYNCYDFQENNRYLIKYDQNGKKLKEEGTVLGQLLYEDALDSIPLNEPFKAKLCVATPPFTKVNVLIGELVDTKLINTQRLKIINNIGNIERKFEKEGKHILISIGELIDETGDVYKTDSIITEIIVKKQEGIP